MIDLPVGKAIIAVYSDSQCNGECTKKDIPCDIDWCKDCDLHIDTERGFPNGYMCDYFNCLPLDRKDGKHVVFKVVDYPVKEKRRKKRESIREQLTVNG